MLSWIHFYIHVFFQWLHGQICEKERYSLVFGCRLSGIQVIHSDPLLLLQSFLLRYFILKGYSGRQQSTGNLATTVYIKNSEVNNWKLRDCRPLTGLESLKRKQLGVVRFLKTFHCLFKRPLQYLKSWMWVSRNKPLMDAVPFGGGSDGHY